ncbi:SpoIIE family protein phosphatase [Fundidesulfovibrio putealis]|uniref:SpoIIE family protein phosphatase n=1 Tax=Fundidesulfovibrio putealis TaxID=270496 RepID=UPI0004845949|nr:SpoIIE family protein phosphatase [Fundidesulfovibrio putealis]
MRIRTKLLILLLAITVIPLLVLGGIRVYSSLELGRDLAIRQSATLVEQARTLMTVIAEDHARTLSREHKLLATSLKLQAETVRLYLLGPVPRDPDPVLYDTDIDRTKESLRLRKLRGRCSWLGRRTGQGEAVDCVDKQVFQLAPGLTRREAWPDIARLADMEDGYQGVSEGLGDLIAWQITALKNGLFSVYPGYGHFLPGYDGRLSIWYQKAISSHELVWIDPFLDHASGEVLFATAVAIRDARGAPMGVSAIMASLNVLLQQNEHTQHLSGNMEAMFVKLEESMEGTRHLRVLAHREPSGVRHTHETDGSRDWKAQAEPHWLTTEDAQTEQLLLERIRAGATSVFQASNRGVPSLWAVAPVPGDVGVLVFTAPMDDILRDVRTATEYLAKRMREQITQAVCILGLTILLVSGLSILISRRFTGPLQQLSEAARQLAKGNFNAKVAIHGKDELAGLGQVFNEMGPRIEENIRFREGVELAMQVQQSLLPHEPPVIPRLDVAGASVYYDETGGDYYDFILRENTYGEQYLAVALGDVSGHGMEAALLMTTARAFLRMRADMPGSPAEIVTSVNRFLSKDTEGTGRFMSLFYLEIEPAGNSLTWVRAGHDPALLYDQNSHEFVELGGAGLTMGVEENWVFQESLRPDFHPGQFVVLGSDGIWETRSPRGEMFGKERFKEILCQCDAMNAKEMVEAVLVALDCFRGESPVEDDVTLVIIKSV